MSKTATIGRYGVEEILYITVEEKDASSSDIKHGIKVWIDGDIQSRESYYAIIPIQSIDGLTEDVIEDELSFTPGALFAYRINHKYAEKIAIFDQSVYRKVEYYYDLPVLPE